MGKKIVFLTLKVFSATGGIEQVCRVAGKALYELGLQYSGSVKVFSLHGQRNAADGNMYFPQTVFKGFNNNKAGFVKKSLLGSRGADVVLLSHINLLLPGVLIKFFRPKVKLVLIAHGIEVWQPLPGWKKKLLNKVNLFLPVSDFTKLKMKELHSLPEIKLSVINNCLSPFLQRPLLQGKVSHLLERYGLTTNNPLLLTVSRMADSEQYKGYDRVIEALPVLLQQYPNLRYLLVGKYDDKEKQRLDGIINKLGLQDVVIFTGFVADEELPLHFTLADLFVMPSKMEGFGIVFIEAMFYGLPVISGNKDGSVDALCNGELGITVDPDNIDEISNAIKKILDKPEQYKPDQQKLQQQFGYEWYKRKLHTALEGVVNG